MGSQVLLDCGGSHGHPELPACLPARLPACLQVVLEVLERNVKRGSLCYERGHTAVLAWCESSRDVAQLTRILTQLCAANRVAGGGVVVVLTQQVSAWVGGRWSSAAAGGKAGS